MSDFDMIEVAADALYAEFENRPLYAQAQMNSLFARELVVAVLRALRPAAFGDLAEAVALAGESAIDRCGGFGSYSAAHSIFSDMIDAILATDQMDIAKASRVEEEGAPR